MRVYPPSAALAPFVREFMVVDVQDETTRLRLPEPGLVLGVRYAGWATILAGDGDTHLPDVSLAAMTATARRMRTGAGGGVVLARFHPGGAAAFFPQPLHQLFGTTVALQDLLPRAQVDELQARVRQAAGDRGRVATLQAFLRARLQPAALDPLVTAAVRAIGDARGAVQIRALARQLAISQDPFEKRFRRVVGASPKQLASLVRLRHAIDSYRPGAPLTRLALDAGYFDQSHFNREFRAVTGQAPGRLLRAGLLR
jgi:AraC-like DNA-binding protein